MRRRALFIAPLIALALAACDDDVPVTTTPTPVPQLTVAPITYVLSGPAVADYQRTTEQAVIPDDLASEAAQPTGAQVIEQQGYQGGNDSIYEQPSQPTQIVTPFATLDSRAYVFATAQGATAFFSARRALDSTVQKGGKSTPVTAPTDDTDQAFVLQEVLAPVPDVPVATRAYIGLARRGRVVIELFGRINVNETTTADFVALFRDQEKNLSFLP